ncbi:hypothetical protein D3C85_513430 [compost metagenome]
MVDILVTKIFRMNGNYIRLKSRNMLFFRILRVKIKKADITPPFLPQIYHKLTY